MVKKEIQKIEKITVAREKDNLKLHDFFIANFKLVAILTVVIVLAGGYFSALKPKYDKITAEADVGELKKTDLAGMEKKLAQLINVKKEYESVSRFDLDKIDYFLPDTQEKDKLLSEVENMVLKNGLLLISLKLEDVKEVKKIVQNEGEAQIDPAVINAPKNNAMDNEIGKIKISMELAGADYDGLKRILETMENNLRLFDVTKVDFSPGTGKTSLEAITYYLKKS